MHLARVAKLCLYNTKHSLRNNGTDTTDFTYGFLYFWGYGFAAFFKFMAKQKLKVHKHYP
ncbi:hypothetical protein ABID22_003000 [Pontibacter aydingkolensis]